MEERTLTPIHNPHTFAKLPKDYEGLCRVFLPRPIHDDAAFQNTVEMADIFAGQRHNRDQADYFEVLCGFIEDYENATEPETKPPSTLELLNHLLETNDMTATAFGELVGVDRSTASRILRGERNLTVPHIKILCERFKLKPEAFLD